MATFDRAAAKAAGYSDAEIDAYLEGSSLGQPDSSRVVGGQRDGPLPDIPGTVRSAAQSVPARALLGLSLLQTPHGRRSLLAEAIPGAAAIGASAAIPEALPFAWLARMGLAGLASGAASPVRQALKGERPTAGQALLTGAENLAGQGVGEVLSAGAGPLARTLMRGAQSRGVTPALQDQYARALSRRLGRTVEPQEADFAVQALKERVPVGPKVLGGQTGSVKVGEKIGLLSNRLDTLLADAERNGMRFNIMDATRTMNELRDQMAMDSQSVKMLAALDKRLKDIVAGKRVKGSQKLVQFTPAQFNDLKRTWQQASEAIVSGRVPAGPKAKFSARIDAQLSRGARSALEDIPGVRETNQRMSELMPLEQVVTEAEKAAVRGRALPNRGLFENMRDAVMRPRLTSRAALGLTAPGVGFGLREGPLTLDALLHMLAARDTVGR